MGPFQYAHIGNIKRWVKNATSANDFANQGLKANRQDLPERISRYIQK